MVEIRLQRGRWFFDPEKPLGPTGGFGTVFHGSDDRGAPVAVKQLKVEAAEAGHRELAIAGELAGKELRYVIPILDSGMDAESNRYYVVMAQAEQSLQAHLDVQGQLDELEAARVLSDVVSGLIEVQDLVHRDLKPGNVLRHEGAWKIADFGIARFVEEATSLATLKGCLSPPYAAPEQWRGERATNATDVYALGCIGFCLVVGRPPFQGDREQLQDAHLNEQPPTPPASPRCQQLLFQCLRKSPQARPSLVSCQRQLEAMLSEPQRTSLLAEAGAAVAAAQAAKEAELAQERSDRERREELASDAVSSLEALIGGLFAAIRAECPLVVKEPDPVLHRLGLRLPQKIELGAGKLVIRLPLRLLPPGGFRHQGKDVVCGALIQVTQRSGSYRGRSANLWYANMDGDYRWWEYAYHRPWVPEVPECVPFALEGNGAVENADQAAAMTHVYGHAVRPVPIDGEMAEDFLRRWSDRLAQAATNSMQRPSTLPEP